MKSSHLLLLVILNSINCQDLVLVKSEEVVDDSESKVDTVEVSNGEVFVPTNEWQEIINGQAIPAGLHARMNLQTGKKEAKLMEDKPAEEDPGLSHEALKEALKNIKSDFKVSKDGEFDPSKFRSMDQLKSELGDVNMAVESDIQIMTKLFSQFKDSESDNDKANIIENLEYYVHQYDNALDFIHLEGFKLIVIPSLNSTNSDLRKQACFLMGGAAQSNPQFQIAALEAGFVDFFLRLTSLDPEPEVSTKAFYALSSVMRNFPEAQNLFMRNGGLGVLTKIFDQENKRYERLKIKILTLIHDLLVERDTSAVYDDAVSEARKKQYELQNFEAQIQESGWCQVLNKMLVLPKSDRQARRDDILSTVSDEFPLRAEHDSIEKILGAMVRMVPACKTELASNSELRSKLSFLGSQYSVLSDKERAEQDGDEFFSSILKMINILNTSIFVQRTEL